MTPIPSPFRVGDFFMFIYSIMTQSNRELIIQRRQSDTGWGWPFAYLLPCVSIYHCWTRRTLTPILTYLAVLFCLGLVFEGAGTFKDMSENEQSRFIDSVALVTLVPSVKLGMCRDNRRANEDKL